MSAALRQFVPFLLLCAVVCGCAEEELEYREVKRIDEELTIDDLNTFIKIVESLPNKQLPELPSIMAPPPTWAEDRTLPVNELISEEQQVLDQHWDVDWIVEHFKKSRSLERALKREKVTLEQLVGLTLTIGTSLSRNTLREDQVLDNILRDGKARIAKLAEEKRPFNTLSQERRHFVLRQAIWITRADRSRRLLKSPNHNIALTKKYEDRLRPLFPPTFTSNPLDAIADLQSELGMPFDQDPKGQDDAQIVWNREDAVIGFDTPDKEFVSEDNKEPNNASATDQTVQ